MSATEIGANKALTWDQLPCNSVFRYDDAFWTKITCQHFLRVEPTEDGSWVGQGEAIKYDPVWNCSFTVVESHLIARALLDHAPDRIHTNYLFLLLVILGSALSLLALISLLLWLL